MSDPHDHPLAAALPDLLAEIGAAPAAFAVERLPTPNPEGGARLVLRLRRPGGGLIYKCGPTDEPRWEAAQVRALRRAGRRLRGHPTAAVPELRAVDAARRAVLMTEAEGETLAVALARAAGPADRTGLLRRAGAWAAALHGAPRTGGPPARPDLGLVAQLGAWGRTPPASWAAAGAGPEAAALAAWGHARAAAWRDGPARIAEVHGDLTPRNLVMGARRVTGFDFGRKRRRSGAFDLAALIVRAAMPLGAGPGAAALDDVRAAVMAGYGGAPPELDAMIAWRLLRFGDGAGRHGARHPEMDHAVRAARALAAR
ncbi:hypothetical protein JQC91_05385 [Jannaschia sp. Os4]|uniref:hypothetical protein n=1 Tax=Jannaschia sp. Os4 TaxID=2807617 RepID=UPI0019392DBB|nr:hypothetical protein [Jannaschia sp. Os4]MBM2575732.1 hypothetical protein [Jannaschia sp. Os4]